MRRVLFDAVVEPFLDALYPARCRLCGVAAPDDLACGEHALPGPADGAERPRCGRCAARLPPVLPDGARCATCRRRPPGFRRALVLGDYRDAALRAWVLALKHGGRSDLAEPLGERLGALAAEAEEERADGRPALVVPVPLHRWRRLERGYDQAALLARAAARRAGLPVLAALGRRRRTPPQGTAGAVSRAANVRAAFAALPGTRAALTGRAVWLVDDVVTSGATASECARELARGGAARVSVLALARAGEERDDVLGSAP